MCIPSLDEVAIRKLLHECLFAGTAALPFFVHVWRHVAPPAGFHFTYSSQSGIPGSLPSSNHMRAF